MSQSSQENLSEPGSASGSLRDSNSPSDEGRSPAGPRRSRFRQHQPGFQSSIVPAMTPFERFLRPFDFPTRPISPLEASRIERLRRTFVLPTRPISPLDASSDEESESSSDAGDSEIWIAVPSNVQNEASPVLPDANDDAHLGRDEDYQEVNIDDDIDRISDASDLDWTRGPFSYEVPFGPRIHERYRFEAEHPDMAGIIRGVRNLPARGVRAVVRARRFGRRVVRTYRRATRQVNQAVDASRDMAVTAGQVLWGAQAATRGAIENIWLGERWRQEVFPDLLAEGPNNDPLDSLLRLIDRVRMAGLRGLEG